jgi:NAD(P) transhydrogenase subunit alpha
VPVRVAVPAETAAGERRVAAVPETVATLRTAGLEVAIQPGAGAASFQSDEAYVEHGAVLVRDRTELVGSADVVLRVQPPDTVDVQTMRADAALIGLLAPASNPTVVRALAGRPVTSFALELVPRISRAQTMDALSSQALVAGYRATLMAAQALPKFFPLFMTAAGTVPPGRVLVLGAGVAGLQAIATARRLGAVVEAYDVRAAAAEEVRSLGATFVELELATQEGAGGYAKEQSEDFLRRQRELLGERVAAADVVITTAAVPGRRAPVLVTTEMVDGMRPGSVIVDLAAETGGNCELTRAGEDVEHGGVTVMGPVNLPSSLPVHASALYARNVASLLTLMCKDGQFQPDFDDEIVAGCCVTRNGEIVHPQVRDAVAGTGGSS